MMSNLYEPVLRSGKFELSALSSPTIQGELAHYHALSTTIEAKRFLGATLIYLNAAALTAEGCRFTDTYFFRASLTGVSFRYCHFTKVKFHECEWRDVQFIDCSFEDCEFARAGEEAAVAARFEHCDFKDPFEKLNPFLESGPVLFSGCSFLNRDIPAVLKSDNEFFMEALAAPAKPPRPAAVTPAAPAVAVPVGSTAPLAPVTPAPVRTAASRFDGIEIHEDKPGSTHPNSGKPIA